MASRSFRAGLLRCAVAAALTVAVPSGAARATSAPPLAGLTVITGSRSAAMAVTLSRPGTVRIAQLTASSPNVRISGNGRVAGFDLRADDGSTTPPHLFASLTNGCYTLRCPQREHLVTTHAAGFKATNVGDGVTQYTLPAGRYRLLLLADGTPVTVRLRVDGLRGATTLRPRGPASVSWDPLEPNLDAGPKPATFAYSAPAGALPVGRRGGMLFTVFDVRLTAGDVGERGFCYYPGPPANRTYVVGCPGATSGGGQRITGLVPQEHTLRGIQFLDGEAATVPGSTGLYYDNVGLVESIDALSVRIAY